MVDNDSSGERKHSRRRYLQATAAGVAGITTLAGCNSSSSSQTATSSAGDREAQVPSGTPAKVETKYWHDWPTIDADSPPMEYTASAGAGLDPITLEFSSEDDPWMREHAFMIQRAFRNLGVPTTLNDRPLNQLYAQSWTTKGLEATVSMSTHGPDPQRGVDPNPLAMRRYKSNPSNYDNYWHPKLNELLAEQRTTTGNREKRANLVDEALKIFAEDVGGIISIFPDVITAVNTKKWNGYVITPGNGPTGDSFQWTEVNLQPTGDETSFVKGTTISMNSLNLPWSSGGAEEKRLKYIYDSLFDASPDLKIIPGLATSASFVDDTTVEMTLREGVKWHDGERFTAEDVKFSADFYKQHSSTSQTPFYTPIESVETLGEHKVRFNLKWPDASFLTQRVVRSVIIPKHRWKDVDNPSKHNPKNPIGTGPFQFGSWSPGTEFVVSRSDDHWMWSSEWREQYLGPAAQSGTGIEQVVWANVGNVDALIGALQNGKLDAVAGKLSNAQAKRASRTGNVEKKVADNFAPLDVKLMWSSPLIRDKEFRVAVAKSVDKEGFVEQVLQGRATVPQGENFLSQLTGWSSKNTYDYKYDVKQAKSILKEAGYTWDSNGNLQFPNGEAWAAYVERIQNGNCHKRRTELGQPSFA
ncbi:ABC transporter substrate-binding protein [Halobellus sp. EA9]|uniref:ABC transporter substrate-binding protein n=1 Tax=Halobellus sp. EA9 TaxID=3421647 RepID=UPI003EC03454